MATGRYGEFQYGDGTLYGQYTATEGGEIIWIVNVDWNGDGSYDGGNEGGYLIDYTINRGHDSYLNEQGQGFEHMGVGTCSLTLDNKDRRYDPRNAASPLYPNVVPGRKVFVAAYDIANETQYTRFTGVIDDVIQMSAPGGGTVRIELVDYMQYLNDQRLTSAAALVDTNISTCIENSLADAGYPGTVVVDNDTQPVYVFGVNDEVAAGVVHELADAALGIFFVDANGKAKFYARNHSYGAGTALDEETCLSNIVPSNPWNEVFDYTKVVSYQVVKEQPSIIYFLSWPKQFAQSTAFTIYPRYDASTDLQISTHEANTTKQGDGTDITSTTALQSHTLNLTGGSITYQNNSNAGYLIGLEIRGRKWRLETEAQENADSPRRFYLDSRYLQDANYMDEFLTIVDGFVSTDRESVTVQIEQRPDLQFGFDLLDPVAFTSATLDIDDTYYVLGIKETWYRGAQGVLTTLNLHKILTDSTSITGTGYSEERAQAPLGYDNPAGDYDTISQNPESPWGGAFQPTAVISKRVINSTAGFNNGHVTDFDVAYDPESLYDSAETVNLSPGGWLIWQYGAVKNKAVSQREADFEIRCDFSLDGTTGTFRSAFNYGNLNQDDVISASEFMALSSDRVNELQWTFHINDYDVGVTAIADLDDWEYYIEIIAFKFDTDTALDIDPITS